MQLPDFKKPHVQQITALLATVIGLALIFAVMLNHANSQSGKFLNVERVDFRLVDTVVYGQNHTILIDGWMVDDHATADASISASTGNFIVLHDSLTSSRMLPTLLAQLKKLEIRCQKHKQTMIYFYGMDYAFIILQGVLLLLTTVFGAVVTKTGWQNTSKIYLIILFILAGCTVFCYSVPKAIDFEGNTATNKEYYIRHMAVIQEAYTYLSTLETIDQEKLTPKQFAHMLDVHIIELQTVAVDFKHQAMQNALDEVQGKYNLNNDEADPEIPDSVPE